MWINYDAIYFASYPQNTFCYSQNSENDIQWKPLLIEEKREYPQSHEDYYYYYLNI